MLALAAMSAQAQVLETSVITDWETVSYYGSVEETENAINAAIEYADNIFVQQLGIDIEVTYVDIPVSESDDTVAGHNHVVSLIESLRDYRYENADHFAADITLFLSVREFTTGSSQYAGYAYVKSICSANSIAMTRLFNNGLDGETLAHEMAHVLGAVHDGDSPCESTNTRGYLMSSAVHTGNSNFSQCSIDTIKTRLEAYGYCMVEDTTVPVITPVPTTNTSRGGGGAIDILFLFIMVVITTLSTRTDLNAGRA